MNSLNRKRPNSSLDESGILIFMNKLSQHRFNEKAPVLSLSDILSEKFGQVEKSFQFNFLVDLKWLISQYPKDKRKDIVIIHGDNEYETNQEFPNNVNLIKVHLPYMYGTHHTKIMVLFYKKCVRIVIHTANLIPIDWENVSQLMWVSNQFPYVGYDKKKTDQFKDDLINYLGGYSVPSVVKLANELKNYDMTSASVHLITSIPGVFKIEGVTKYGHVKLREVVSSIKNKGTKFISQVSSLGSFGKDDHWIRQEFGKSLTGCSKEIDKGNLFIMYPTYQDIKNSLIGFKSGHHFPYSSVIHQKQPYINEYLCKWKSEKLDRKNIVSHSKVYMGTNESFDKICWCMITSANLSKSAWGFIKKNGKEIFIRSYEVGVLFKPEDYGVSWFSNFTIFKNSPLIGFCLPFDLPPVNYREEDSPWMHQIEEKNTGLK